MRSFLVFGLALMLLSGCASSKYGAKVENPYAKLTSNKKFWRGSGMGQSREINIAEGKADLQAKAELAGQVNTTMKQVADQYLSQNENEAAFDLGAKFQSITRQVMNTNIADLRKIGEKQYYNDAEQQYTVFTAYEIKKKAMLKFMKKQAKLADFESAAERELIEKLIDLEIEKAEE
jgi:hypothetical protein